MKPITLSHFGALDRDLERLVWHTGCPFMRDLAWDKERRLFKEINDTFTGFQRLETLDPVEVYDAACTAEDRVILFYCEYSVENIHVDSYHDVLVCLDCLKRDIINRVDLIRAHEDEGEYPKYPYVYTGFSNTARIVDDQFYEIIGDDEDSRTLAQTIKDFENHKPILVTDKCREALVRALQETSFFLVLMKEKERVNE